MLPTCRSFTILTVVLCFVAHMTDGAPRNRRGVARGRRPSEDRWYDWPCPRLECPSVAGCQTVEVVMWVHGPRLCEGCPYCVDWPYNTGLNREVRAQSTKERRFIRSLSHLKPEAESVPVVLNDVCEFVNCPLKRPSLNCTRASILDGYLRGDKCISCAFCADDVTNTSQHGGHVEDFLTRAQ